jgi:hypothetical protein
MSKGNYIKKARQYMRHEKLSIIPAPNRVLIRITKQQIEDLISKVITKADGTTIRLFFEPILFDQGFERRFSQNISVGNVIGVGINVRGIEVGDTVILDYLSSNLIEECVGFFNEDQLISMLAYTTYHDTSSVLINGRRAWAKGDYDHVSRILGVVRGDKLIPFDPYVFIEYVSDYLKILNARGEATRSSEVVINRVVISAPEGVDYKCGETIFLKKDDWFDREIAGRKIAVVFKGDILCKV